MSNTIFRIAHLSDPHLGPLPAVPTRDLIGKRLTGFINWHRTRKHIHDMNLLARVAADIRASAPDLVLVGGDLANVGHAAEFVRARDFVTELGPPGRVLLTPGNHDIYVAESLAMMLASLGPWMAGDDGAQGRFPLLLRRAGIGVVALNSGATSLPFYATGRLGQAQIAAAGRTLAMLGAEGRFRLVLVHHAPQVGGSRIFRNLLDAPAFEAMLGQAGAELVVHGHNHRTSLAHRPGPSGPVPIVGVGSASAAGGSNNHRATWHRIDIEHGRASVVVRNAESNGRFSETPMAID